MRLPRKHHLLLAAIGTACCILLLLRRPPDGPALLCNSPPIIVPGGRPTISPDAASSTSAKPPSKQMDRSPASNPIHISPPSCRGLLAGRTIDIHRAKARGSLRPADFMEDVEMTALSCSQLTAGYWTGPVSDLELGFPIAFSVVAHRSFYQVNRLMQAVHRSHNTYCLHIDSKSSAKFTAAAKRLASCLSNLVLVESPVVWGQASVLLADLRCFSALLYSNRTWNYVINLTGQEYPIRTLMEMVQILKLMNGSNNMERLIPRNYNPYPRMTDDTGLSDLRWYKGSAHAIISGAAVRYMLEDRRAQLILQHIQKHYVNGRTIPDETFYATLNHNYELLTFPGSYTGNLVTTNSEYRQIYRYKIWSQNCRSGLSVRGICIIGAADLKDFNSRPELIANKMYFDFQSDAFLCVQERFWNNTKADYDPRLKKTFVVSLKFFSDLEFVVQHA